MKTDKTFRSSSQRISQGGFPLRGYEGLISVKYTIFLLRIRNSPYLFFRLISVRFEEVKDIKPSRFFSLNE